MKKSLELLLKIAIGAALCVFFLAAPFLLAAWLMDEYGFHIPRLVVLGISIFCSLSVYFLIVGKDLAAARHKAGQNTPVRRNE